MFVCFIIKISLFQSFQQKIPNKIGENQWNEEFTNKKDKETNS